MKSNTQNAKIEAITENTLMKKILISFGLANEQGYLTNAGALIVDESPIRCVQDYFAPGGMD